MNKQKFLLDQVELPSNVFYAPLAGCSDFPFRQISSRYNPGLIFCEMVKMDPLVRNDPGTLQLLDFHKEMHPISGQICGSKPELAGPSAKIIEDLGFISCDLNCGCPVDKVTKDGSGSGLLQTPEKIGDIISNMVAAVKIPVTLKIRIGWDEENINATTITQIAEQAGAKAICVHGRTREQAYRGPANWEHIKACKQIAKTIKVIGNGDIHDAHAAIRMFEETGCDAVLVARGTMGQPWIAEDIYLLQNGLPPKKRTINDSCQTLLEHFELMALYYPEKKVVMEMRRVGCWYIKNTFGAREFRETLNKAQSLVEVKALLQKVFQQIQSQEALD